MKDQLVADRQVHRPACRPFVGRRAVASDRLEVNGLFGDDTRNPRVQHIDDAADRRRTEEQRGRTAHHLRSEEHTSELQSLMRISYAVFCLKKKKSTNQKK